MKKSYLIFTLFILIPFNSFAQQGWYYKNPIPVSSELRSVQFVSVDTGWAIGSNGDIICTTDGGENWELRHSNIDHVSDIFFVDDQFGWAVGLLFTGEINWYPVYEGVLLNTTDGGENWTIQKKIENYIGGPCPISLYFTDSETGWIACKTQSSPNYNSFIMKTIDGGENWIVQDSVDLNIFDLYFVNNQVGWAVGGWSGAFEVTILKTDDGGENWISQSGGVNGVLGSVYFLDENNGWTVGEANTILKTTNGGTNWIQQSISGTNHQLTSVCFADTNLGFIAGWSIFLTTTDGGSTWSVITYPDPNALCVFFINNITGWRVGSDGAIQKTTNGGESWTDQFSSFTYEDFIHVDFVNVNNGWIISPASIYHTGDAGDIWQLQKTAPYGSLNYISAADSLNCWVVGYDYSTSSSLILNTTDGGNLWEKQQVACDVPLNSACFIDNNVGWAVGDSGLIIFTDDGGQNWIQQESGVSGPLSSVDFINSDYGWIAGYNYGNIILYTKNGGQNWSVIIPDSLLSNLLSIEFVDSLNGWGVGSFYNYYYYYGYIYHTGDGGITWELQYSGLAKYSSIKFINENIGWVTGGGGFVSEKVLTTTDGGENWVGQYIPIGWTNGIDFVDLNNGWLVGGGGLIMHTTNGGVTFIEAPGESVTKPQMNFTLYYNYPNPFNPTTKISYSIPQLSKVVIKVYDILGNEIETLVNQEKPAGTYEITLDAGNLPSGVYFYQIKAGSFIEAKKMILLK